MAASETYCLCGQPYATGQFMIECDCCREWFHGGKYPCPYGHVNHLRCVNVKIYQSEDIDKYHCPKCVPAYGPSVYKVPTNIHRQDRYELNAERKPPQTGSETFVANLATRVFPISHVVRMDGRNFTEVYIKEKGFTQPHLFESAVGLDLRVPPAATFTVRTVERHCGASKEVDVIDVTRQTNFKMMLGDFVDYFTEANRTKVLNVLSLEFSDTTLSGLVQPPAMARQLDWVRSVWPSSAPPFSPLVQKYCIMSAAASYTDFHIDFGGTTVWYHVLHGKKIFYMIPPTPNNLDLYQQWSMSPRQNEVFFGDLVTSCSTCILKRGQTLFIPTGWIHAVLTPEDSLVFGGNFLHSYSIELQLQCVPEINEIEKRVETPTMFRFPLFETIHWYAGLHMLQQLRRINEEQQDEDFTLDENKDSYDRNSQLLSDLPSYMIRGIKFLATTLKEWNACKSYDPTKKQNIPESVNSGQLVRDLSRELRRLDKLLTPSYPNHSSNKKKKKKPRPVDIKMSPNANRHFSSVSKDQVLMNNLNIPSLYTPTNTRSLYNTHSTQNKKSLKLTLPKPIMHVPDSQHIFSNSSQDSEDAELNNMASIASRSGIAAYSHSYDSQDSFGAENDYRIPGENSDYERKVKKSSSPQIEQQNLVMKIKSAPPEATLRPPPDYAGEHSILKSHLINNTPSSTVRHQKPSNQWTISKSHVKNNTTDSTDEQILFTNENLSMPGTSTSNLTSYVNANMFDGHNVLYGAGLYTSGDQINQSINHVTTDAYNPDFILDRKNTGLLPDYSPTKSINEYAKNTFIDQKSLQNVGNFANNSDPYSQGVRAHDSASPFSDDSSIMTGAGGYRMVHTDTKDEVMLQSNVGSDSYQYLDMDDKRNTDLILIDKVTGQMKKVDKYHHRQGYGLQGEDYVVIYNGNVNAHGEVESVNPLPPPSYESSIAPRRTSRPTRRRIDPRSSIYDYEDQDDINEGDLYIDEAPKPSSSKKKRKPPVNKDVAKVGLNHGYDGEKDLRVPEGFAAPKNGIESLLQASELTGSPGADNQERDAVAGMLSIGQSYGLARAESSRRLPPAEGPPIKAVHKDDEYVYPSLELSSEDEDDMSPPRRSTSRSRRRRNPFTSPPGDKSDREDETWWPCGPLGNLLPKVNRPLRRGSHREAVQAALRAARLRGAPQVPPDSAQPAAFAGLTVEVDRSSPIHTLPVREPSSLSISKKSHKKKKPVKLLRPIPTAVQQVLPSPNANKNIKFKKGMKTAKQRLGKILKIHKMMC